MSSAFGPSGDIGGELCGELKSTGCRLSCDVSHMTAHKVLFLGSPQGHVRAMVEKTKAIDAKHGPFSGAFIVGDVFSPEKEPGEDERAFLDGSLQMPMPTYFFYGTGMSSYVKSHVDAKCPDHRGPACIAPNLYYLGSAGLVMIQGLRVAFCGGVWAPEADPLVWRKPTGTDDTMPDAWSTWDALDTPAASEAALQSLLRHPSLALGEACAPEPPRDPESLQQVRSWQYAQGAFEFQQEQDVLALQRRRAIDFLLTNAWPLGIDMLSDVPLDEYVRATGLAPMARLAEACRPRYHIAHVSIAKADGVFWEREPYENWPFAKMPPPAMPPITRFVSLAHAANSSKRRWFLALQVVPSDELLANTDTHPHAPNHTTPAPLWQQRMPTLIPPKRAPVEDFPAPRRKRRQGGRQPIEPASCWFCLSNPAVEKHLIVAIGTECYIALPKGQLPVSSDASALVPGGGHVLIVPIAHTPSLYASEAATSKGAMHAEMAQWKHALTQCYASFDAVPVTWEIVRRASRVAHAHVQVVPLARDLQADYTAYVREAAEREGWHWESEQVAAAWTSECTRERSDYFYMTIGDTSLLLILDGERFNMQFARETLASFLGMPERADWHACVQTREIESAERDEFKDALAEFAAHVVSGV